jgi:hypothetical protein
MEEKREAMPAVFYELKERVAVLEEKHAALFVQSLDNRNALRKVAWAVMTAVMAAGLAAVVDWVQSGGGR